MPKQPPDSGVPLPTVVHDQAQQDPEEPLLNETQVAEFLGLSVATIRKRRRQRQPPAWIKIGTSVRYRRDAVARLIASAEHSLEVG